jgi:hypothetical protein
VLRPVDGSNRLAEMDLIQKPLTMRSAITQHSMMAIKMGLTCTAG